MILSKLGCNVTAATTKPNEEYLKSLAFARMLGYLTTDGHISKKYNASIFLGHMLDVEGLLNVGVPPS